MNPVSTTDAMTRLSHLIEQTNESHEPVLITGKRGNAVLLSESDWLAVQESLYLGGISELVEDVKKGLTTPLDECSQEPGW
ncbi:MAG: type II toxin-antitoxin system Phd/YefM family antitoxin [Planctomycetes bacterium]|nr:type II toxin-antitoxin system Phd/YefM family antitoxin [Planctomycetota bacterium]